MEVGYLQIRSFTCTITDIHESTLSCLYTEPQKASTGDKKDKKPLEARVVMPPTPYNPPNPKTIKIGKK
eukprot:467442-Amphidinium_carterae.1